ncbi:MAG TPA: portal protein [Desulfosporosinus sp.]|nr:portal protein [Desulfosporosinus sp.]
MATAKQILERYQSVVSLRTNWDSHWRDVAELVLPRKDNVFFTTTRGEKKHNLLFDSTAIQTNDLLASALQGMLTNPTTIWFEMATGNPAIDDLAPVRLYLQQVVERMIDILNNSNFHTEMHEVYLDLGCFGTGTLCIEEDDKFVVRFKSFPIHQAWIAENNKGQIDTVFRKYRWDARRIKQEFGEKVFDQVMKHKNFKRSLLEEQMDVLHAVFPREEEETNLDKGPKGYPWASYYVLIDTSQMLKVSGFKEFPFCVPRWSKINDEIYGRSPAMKALPDIQMVNEMMRTVIRSAQKIVDPPLQLPDDGVLLPIKTTPNAVNYYRAGTTDRIEPLLTQGRPDIGMDMIQDVRSTIRDAFYVNQLQLAEDNPQMTATEVLQRTEEKMRLLGPVLARQQFELLRPLIDRVYNIMERRELLPEAPPELADKDLQVKYSSPIARAQRATESGNLLRMVQVSEPIIMADPKVLDVIDGDKWVREAAKIFALPQQVIRSEAEVEELRGARMEAQQATIEQDQVNQDAENVKKVTPLLKEGR